MHIHNTFTLRDPGAADTGLRRRSQVMAAKATTIPRAEAGNRTGRLDEDEGTLARVSGVLAAFLGFG